VFAQRLDVRLDYDEPHLKRTNTFNLLANAAVPV
jgi:hypothetical protein